MSDENKIEPEEFFKTLTGWDEIAVAQRFKASPAELAVKAEQGDTFGLMRCLLFVVDRRAGAKDAEAFKRVMDLSAGDVADRFTDPPAVQDPGKDSPEI
jgi:hypothetical protein